MANDLLRGRQTVEVLTNKSGETVDSGDVVILDTSNEKSFTTTSSRGNTSEIVGVSIESILDGSDGRILFFGHAPKVNLYSFASIGDYLITSPTGTYALPVSALEGGVFGQCLTSGTNPEALVWGLAPLSISVTGSNSGHTILQSDGTELPARTYLSITGSGAEFYDDAAADTTVLFISGSSGGGGGTTLASAYVGVVLYDETLESTGRFYVSGTLSGYDDLEVTLLAKGTVAAIDDSVYLYFNNDETATNYRYSRHLSGDGHLSADGDDFYIGGIGGASTPDGGFSLFNMKIPDYSKAYNYKNTLSTNSQYRSTTVSYTQLVTATWENTDPITQIALQPNGYPTDEFISGSHLKVVGYKTMDILIP